MSTSPLRSTYCSSVPCLSGTPSGGFSVVNNDDSRPATHIGSASSSADRIAVVGKRIVESRAEGCVRPYVPNPLYDTKTVPVTQELIERWEFPADHLPIAAQVDQFYVASWKIYLS